MGKRAKTDKVDAQMLALMGQALQLDPTAIRDEVIEMLGEYELLRLWSSSEQPAKTAKILTNKTFKRLVAKQIRQIEKDLTALEAKALSELKKNP